MQARNGDASPPESDPSDDGPANGSLSEDVAPNDRTSKRARARTSPEELPAPADAAQSGPELRVPMSGEELADSIEFSDHNGLVTLVAREVPLSAILNLLAQQEHINMALSEDLNDPITVTLTNVPFDNALSAVVAMGGCTWTQKDGIIFITRIDSEAKGGPAYQGRQVRVFPLSYASAEDVDLVLKGLISPVGKSFITQTSPTDTRKAQEVVVVEDLPQFIAPIAECIAQMDQPPRQVLIEAHILQVDLKDELKHGVDLSRLVQIAGTTVSMKTLGFVGANDIPTTMMNISGQQIDHVLECLLSTTNAKSLAAPQVSALNGQEAMIQIGSRLGYRITTATVTTSMQSVQFLEVGVVLKVTPFITADNQVLMQVAPKVSSGQVNQDSGLPQEDTTQVGTTALVPNGHGVVIGGLIKETDSDIQAKVPLLGDIWLIGKIFQRRDRLRQRQEIIIALIPRIVPYSPEYEAYHKTQVVRAMTPLLQGPLQPVPRPWEAKLPDAEDKPRWFRRSQQNAECVNGCPPGAPQQFTAAPPAGLQPMQGGPGRNAPAAPGPQFVANRAPLTRVPGRGAPVEGARGLAPPQASSPPQASGPPNTNPAPGQESPKSKSLTSRWAQLFKRQPIENVQRR